VAADEQSEAQPQPPESPRQSADAPPSRPPGPRPGHYVILLWTAALVLLVVGLLGLDRVAYQFSRTLNTPHPADVDFYARTRWFWDLCRFGGSIFGGIAAFIVVWALHPRGLRMAMLGLIVVIAADLTGNVVRRSLGRPRPNLAHSYLEFQGPRRAFVFSPALSFPSGEATDAFALAAVLTYAWRRWRPAFYAAATLTALARVIVGAHYVSDVVAGAMIGAGVVRWLLPRADAAMDRWLGRVRGKHGATHADA
jgi:membrane-associated phospholipid phosphatase